MPQRTNPFQAVIFLIQKHIAGEATATESAELTDLVSGERREVDVCIETEVASHGVIISLECRDHGRPQTIGWIEEMHAKHSRLPTSVLVLVSSSGFTRNALAAAQSYGIETVVPEDLSDERAGEIADRVPGSPIRTDVGDRTGPRAGQLDRTDVGDRTGPRAGQLDRTDVGDRSRVLS